MIFKMEIGLRDGTVYALQVEGTQREFWITRLLVGDPLAVLELRFQDQDHQAFIRRGEVSFVEFFPIRETRFSVVPEAPPV